MVPSRGSHWGWNVCYQVVILESLLRIFFAIELHSIVLLMQRSLELVVVKSNTISFFEKGELNVMCTTILNKYYEAYVFICLYIEKNYANIVVFILI